MDFLQGGSAWARSTFQDRSGSGRILKAPADARGHAPPRRRTSGDARRRSSAYSRAPEKRQKLAREAPDTEKAALPVLGLLERGSIPVYLQLSGDYWDRYLELG